MPSDSAHYEKKIEVGGVTLSFHDVCSRRRGLILRRAGSHPKVGGVEPDILTTGV